MFTENVYNKISNRMHFLEYSSYHNLLNVHHMYWLVVRAGLLYGQACCVRKYNHSLAQLITIMDLCVHLCLMSHNIAHYCTLIIVKYRIAALLK